MVLDRKSENTDTNARLGHIPALAVPIGTLGFGDSQLITHYFDRLCFQINMCIVLTKAFPHAWPMAPEI